MSQPWNSCGGLSSDQIRNCLAKNQPPGRDIPTGYSFRNAAVLVPMVCENGELSLLFTRRTDLVHDHKGQVSFPGGTSEKIDRTADDTALRETYEEIGIPPAEVCILGRLPPYPTITGFVITPVIGLIPWPYDLRFSQEEVSRVFTVPLVWLANPGHRDEREMTLPDGRIESIVFFHPYDGEKVWGVTARITMSFLNVLDLG